MINKVTKRIIIWNCRGAASNAFHRVHNQFVKVNIPYILVIMKTRMESLKLANTFSQLGFNYLVGSKVEVMQ